MLFDHKLARLTFYGGSMEHARKMCEVLPTAIASLSPECVLHGCFEKCWRKASPRTRANNKLGRRLLLERIQALEIYRISYFPTQMPSLASGRPIRTIRRYNCSGDALCSQLAECRPAIRAHAGYFRLLQCLERHFFHLPTFGCVDIFIA